MDETGSWVDAVLTPRDVAPPLNGSPQLLDDRVTTAMLISGRFHTLDQALQAGDEHRTLAALVDPGLPSHPTSSALSAWLFDPSRTARRLIDAGRGTTADAPDRRACHAVLAAVALAQLERFPEAVELLTHVRADLHGIHALWVGVQLSCRLLEAGDPAAAGLCEELITEPGADGALADDLVRTARWNLLAADRDGDMRFDLLLDLQMSPIGSGVIESARLSSTGLMRLTEDVLAIGLASPMGPSSHWSVTDFGLDHLTGDWLLNECWGAYGDMRAARRRLGSYGIVKGLLPYPPGWSRTVPDGLDLDLLRRGGKAQLVRDVTHHWWQTGPLEPVQRVLDHVARRAWVPTIEEQNLAVLRAAGDLLAREDADRMIEKAVSLADRVEGHRSYAVRHTVARALPAVIQNAGPEGLDLTAGALVRWADDGSRRTDLIPLAASLPDLPPGACSRLLEWAESSLRDRNSVELAIEVALRLLTATKDGKGHPLLVDAFRATPTAGSAAGILRSPQVTNDERDEVATWLHGQVTSGRQSDGRWGFANLLAASADVERDTPVLHDLLMDVERPLARKNDVLVQLSTRPDLAGAVITPSVVVLLAAQAESAGTPILGNEASWPWVAAAAAAGPDAIDPERVYAWITARIGGRPDEQWEVARILGPASSCLDVSDLIPLWTVAVAAAHVVVAAQAADWSSHVIEAADDDAAVRERIEQALRRLLAREGSWGSLAAGHALADIGAITEVDVAVIRGHPSAHIRRILNRTEGRK